MMPNERRLQFKDRFVYHLTRQIEGECEGEPILFPDNETPIKFVVEMSQNEFTALLSALMTGADLSYPENSHEVVWYLLRQVECPVSICDEILECLQPAFDEINAKLDDITTTVLEVEEVLENNVVAPPPEPVSALDTALCGAAVGVVEAMHGTNMQIYRESENSLVDNVFEAIPTFIEAFPFIGELPFDEIFELVDAYFENQMVDYETDFEAIKQDMIDDLYCQVADNDGTFTYDIWADWLDALEADYPGNRAAAVFARFSPLRQTFINQLAQFLFNQNSLRTYFDQLYTAFVGGSLTPSGTCINADCYEVCGIVYNYDNQPPDFTLQNGTLDPDGFIDSVLFDPGGCGAQWAAYLTDTPAIGATAVRLIYSNQAPEAVQIITATGVYAQDANPPVHVGFEQYMHTVTFPAPLTDDIDRVVVRSTCGVNAPYKIKRVEICFP